MLRVKAVHRFVATASRRRLEIAAARRPAGSVHGLMLRSAAARYHGDVRGSVSLLMRAASIASPKEMPYIRDLLGPAYVALEDRENLSDLLAHEQWAPDLEGPRMGLQAILAAMEGEPQRSRDLRRTALQLVESSDDRLLSARILQRLALAAYRCGDTEEATQHALRCARLATEVEAHGIAATAYSVAYNVHQSVTGDVELALDFANKMAECASLAGNESYEFVAFVARYELAAEIADERLLSECRAKLRSRLLPQQYRERFASGVADVIQFAWRGDFAAFRAGVVLLQDATARTRGEKALCVALRSLAEAGNREPDRARRASRAALSLSSFRSLTGSVPYELRYLRLAHALASATCVIVGDAARGRRLLQTKVAMDWTDSTWPLDVADGANWEAVPQRIRGYCRVVAEARLHAMVPGQQLGLTRGELRILRLLADGMNAPEIAKETERSVHTVRAHTRAIIAKLGVRGRYAAISQARERGFLA
jgi:DNA-binding CsgD family transcriptional regulator